MHEVAQARRHILAAVAALPVGLIVGRTAWGQRATAPQPPQAVVWDRRLGDGRMPFQPSWSYAAANDPTKGTVHAARLTRVVEGIAGVEFVCDRDGPRLDIRLTQPDLALAGAAREARVPITLETSCRLCGGPIDNRPGAPIGSFDWNASTQARIVERDARSALVRIDGAALKDIASPFTRKSHFARLGFGSQTRAILLDFAHFRVIYEFQTMDCDLALAALVRACPEWPR